MDKGSFAKFLIVLVLMSGTLSGCPFGKSPESQGSTPSNPSTSPKNEPVPSSKSSEVEQKLKDLKNAYDEYRKSQTQLISNLPKSIDDNDSTPEINSKDAGDNLKKFAQASENFRKALHPLNQEDRKYQILNELDETQKKLSSQVLKPLENGLQKPEITQVQQNLKVLEKRRLDPKYYGKWGELTQKDTTEFLEENAKKIATNIEDLEQAITSKKPSTTSPRPSTTPNKPQTSTASPEEVNKLTQEVNNLKLVSLMSLVIAILAIALSISEKWRKNSGQSQSIHNRVSSSSQINEEYLNQIEQKNYQHIYQEFDHLFLNIDNRLKQIERQVGSKVDDTQQSRIVSDQQTPKTYTGKNTQLPRNVLPQVAGNQQNPSQHSKLIEYYNHNASAFLKSATKVSETEESISDRRLGKNQPAVIEKNGQGNYCIINEAGVNYLVPKDKFKLNQFNSKTFEALFECRGYQSGYSSNFRLVKPAIVTPISGNNWQLIERGIVEFYS